MPKSEDQFTAFYRNGKAVQCEFSGEALSSDAGLLLLEKLERKHGLIREFAAQLPDKRAPDQVVHTYRKQIQQRVFLMGQGYADGNDSSYLRRDPVLEQLLDRGPCSQPTLSRMENSMDRATMLRLYRWWIDRYVEGLPEDSGEIILDVDTTDDPTHGAQQLSLFHGYYRQWMYQELVVFDGQSGQLVLPVLLPGTWYAGKAGAWVLGEITEKIRSRFPDIRILIRADAGFSCPRFYRMVQQKRVEFCLGMGANPVLKALSKETEERVRREYLARGEKHQCLLGPFCYQAGSWVSPQSVYAKVESTGKGMNTRFFVSNIANEQAASLYFDFYVRRGETCENRIKELKNMCYSDRLSCHRFWANAFRLLLSGLVYEFFRLIKNLIGRTRYEQATSWMIDNIRLYLLKVGAMVCVRARYLRIRLARAFSQQNLFRELIQLC